MSRHFITKCYTFSKLTAHFIQYGARRHGVSESEFCRRVIDAALIEWTKHGLYSLPAGLNTSEESSTRPYARLTPEKLHRLRNGKPPHNTPTVA